MQKDQSGQIEKELQIQQLFRTGPQPLICQDDRFDSYIEQLKQKGVIVHQSIKCGIFQLKNGLKYPGLYTQQNLQSQGKQTILATIPVSLLLTAYHAQHNCAQQLKQLYKKQQYYHSGLIWQNRILVTFMLYNLEKNKDDIWSKMGSHFSRDIDIAQFWPLEDLSKFADQSVMRAALSEKQNFEKQWKEFQKVKINNPMLHSEMFSYQNYKWIYTHVVSRCFGSYMNSSFFTPFCQFFNHNCVDVSFCCVEEAQYLQMSNEQKKEQKYLSSQHQPQESIQSISECSGDSQQYIQQDDYSYEKVATYNIKWYSKIGLNLKQKQTAQILEAQSKVTQFLDRQLKWIGFSLLYIGQILQKNNLIVNEYMAERKKFLMAKQELQLLLCHAGLFLRKVGQYYNSLGSTYFKDKDKFNKMPLLKKEKQQIQKQLVCGRNEKKQEQKSSEIEVKNRKTTKAPQKPFKYFTMVCHQGQQFQKRSEVYFEYGRLSNRTLLLCYGFCLQNNIYDHVWIHRNLAKQIGQYPDLFNKIQQKGLPITFNIKLKPYVLNTELITLQKVEKWKIYGSISQSNVKDFDKIFGIEDLQNQNEIINNVIQTYKLELIRYELKDKKFIKLQNGLFDLKNRDLSYHDYFNVVYHNEKIKILRFQIFLLKKVQEIFKIILTRRIKIKGNSKLNEEIKKITIEQMGKPKLTKAVWGYIRMLVTSIIS